MECRASKQDRDQQGPLQAAACELRGAINIAQPCCVLSPSSSAAASSFTSFLSLSASLGPWCVSFSVTRTQAFVHTRASSALNMFNPGLVSRPYFLSPPRSMSLLFCPPTSPLVLPGSLQHRFRVSVWGAPGVSVLWWSLRGRSSSALCGPTCASGGPGWP